MVPVPFLLGRKPKPEPGSQRRSIWGQKPQLRPAHLGEWGASGAGVGAKHVAGPFHIKLSINGLRLHERRQAYPEVSGSQEAERSTA